MQAKCRIEFAHEHVRKVTADQSLVSTFRIQIARSERDTLQAEMNGI